MVLDAILLAALTQGWASQSVTVKTKGAHACGGGWGQWCEGMRLICGYSRKLLQHPPHRPIPVLAIRLDLTSGRAPEVRGRVDDVGGCDAQREVSQCRYETCLRIGERVSEPAGLVAIVERDVGGYLPCTKPDFSTWRVAYSRWARSGIDPAPRSVAPIGRGG
jgi:hypothetical protein